MTGFWLVSACLTLYTNTVTVLVAVMITLIASYILYQKRMHTIHVCDTLYNHSMHSWCTGLCPGKAVKGNVPAVNQPPSALYENMKPLPSSSTDMKRCPVLYENIEPLLQSSTETRKHLGSYENIQPFPQSSIEMKECPAYGVIWLYLAIE